MTRAAIALLGYGLAVLLAIATLSHTARAYAPATLDVHPKPRPPMTCSLVSGQMKCEVRK